MEQDIGRSEITMQNAFLYELNEPLEDVAHILEGFGWRQLLLA